MKFISLEFDEKDVPWKLPLRRSPIRMRDSTSHGAPAGATALCAPRQDTGKPLVKSDTFSLLEVEEALTDYRFGSSTIHHLFCGRCGVKPFGRAFLQVTFGGETLSGEYYAVNVACLDDAATGELRERRSDMKTGGTITGSRGGLPKPGICKTCGLRLGLLPDEVPVIHSGASSKAYKSSIRRATMSKLNNAMREFLNGRHYATLATYNEDGTIHLTPVWYLFEDGRFYVETSPPRGRPGTLSPARRLRSWSTAGGGRGTSCG